MKRPKPENHQGETAEPGTSQPGTSQPGMAKGGTLSVKLPSALEGDLEAYAEHRGVSKSMVVREAIAEYVFEDKPRQRRSALAMVEDLVGSVEGPEDLSSNPDHLDDFGT